MLTIVYITENDSTVCYFNKVRYLFGMNNWHYPELRSYFTLKSLLHSGLKQVMSLFTLGSARAVLVVALVYSFPVVFNVIYIYRILLSFNVLNWHWSPLTQTSLLLSPSDGLASFLKTTLANDVKVVKKVKTSKFRFHLIAIYALGCFCNFSCTPVPTKITLKSPLPPTPVRLVKEWILMILIKKTFNLKTVYILIYDVFFS